MREVADLPRDGRPRWVAGALGPTNKTLSLSPDVNDPGFREVDFDQVKTVYREQIDALVEGGVDFILIETIFDTLNAKAACDGDAGGAAGARRRAAADDLDDPDRPQPASNRSGHTVEAFWASVRHARPLTIGLNCSFGGHSWGRTSRRCRRSRTHW